MLPQRTSEATVSFECPQCGKLLTVYRSQRRQFCSRACFSVATKDAEWHRGPPRKQLDMSARDCLMCGVPFTPTRHKTRDADSRLCSVACVYKYGNTVFRDNATLSRETAAQRGDATRGRGAGKTYTKRMGRHEHRVIAEQMLGRPLRPGEVVHHEDRDKRNNDPSNLIVFASQAEHAAHHALQRL